MIVLGESAANKQAKRPHFARKDGSGRMSKRRSFHLQTGWGVFSTSRGSQKENRQPQEDVKQDNRTSWSADGESITCTSTLIPTEAASRRNRLRGNIQGSIARKSHAGGTGRSTQLRSFTLHLTLPVPLPLSPALPSPLFLAPSSNSSFEPHFINAGTPVAGIPEWLPHGAMMARSKTPSVQSHPAPPARFPTSQTPGFNFTPMEGVPERCYPRPQTAHRLALLAQYPPRHQQEEDALVMHKANDDILLPEPAIDDEECQMEASASSSSISCHPMVTPHGRHREIDIQVGNSLGKERVIVPRVSNGAARLEVLKTPAPQKGIEEAEHPPLEYAGNDDDDNNDVPGFCDDGPESEGVEDQQAAEDRILANEPKSSIRPEPSIAPAHAHKPEAEPDTAAGPSKSRGRPAGATKRPREMLKKETEAERRGRKSLAGDGLVVDETNGTRRSSRAHQRPLEYWRNEHKVFGRDHQTLPTVTRYETRTPNPSWPLSNKGKEGKKRARTRG